jgi:hypothetical protein
LNKCFVCNESEIKGVGGAQSAPIAEIAGIARDRKGKDKPYRGSTRIREAAAIEQWSGSFYSLFRELRLLE